MKAAVLYGAGDLRVEEIKKPAIKAGEVLLRVACCGICGSDIPRVLQGAVRHFPLVLGHEFSGTVVEVGEAVKGAEVGERVAAAPLVPCHVCADCKNGDYSLCAHYSFIGSRVNGAWAEFVAVPARNLIKLPDNVTFLQGALLEPLTVALHGLLLAGLENCGDAPVAVIGMGTIGFLTLQAARMLGAENITAFDIDEEKLAIARTHGAAHAVNAAGDVKEETARITDGRGFAYVIEASGAGAAEKMALAIAGKKSTVMLIGTPSRSVTFEPAQLELINRKELWLSGSWMSYSAPFPGREWQLAVYAFASSRMDVSPVIDRTVPLGEIRAAFDDIAAGAVRGKIMLEMR